MYKRMELFLEGFHAHWKFKWPRRSRGRLRDFLPEKGYIRVKFVQNSTLYEFTVQGRSAV